MALNSKRRAAAVLTGFISIALPVAVFLSLQRYFVRGLLAGGTKG